MKKILKNSYIFIGFLILAWLLKSADLPSLKKEFLKINIVYFLAGSAFYLPIMFIKGYRFKKIMEAQNTHYSIKDSFLIYGSSMFLGLATPGRLGDFSKIIYLKHDNHSFSKAFFLSLADKFIDLFAVLLFIFAAIFFIPFPFSFDFQLSSAQIFLIISFLLLFFVLFLKYKKLLLPFFTEAKGFLKKSNIKISILVLFLTFFDLFVSFILNYFIAASVGMHNKAGFFYLSFASSVNFLINTLPISVLGIGTRDAAFLVLFKNFGITKENIILFSLMTAASYIGLFIVGFICWIKKPLFK